MLTRSNPSYLESLSSLLVLRGELFAVSAPGRVELDDPDAVAVLHPVVEVVVRQLDDARTFAVKGGHAGQG